jgi:hypothetical protein
MDDLDAMLDDTAAEMLPTVFDLDAALKEKNLMNDVKPWLAFSSNVPVSKRDEWSKMVKVDALAQLPVSENTNPPTVFVFILCFCVQGRCSPGIAAR